MSAPRVRVVVFMKALAESKSRLGLVLRDERRLILSLGLLSRVLSAAEAARTVDNVFLLGSDDAVRRLGERYGAEWLQDGAEGLNQALGRLIAESDAWDTTVLLPGDLAFLTPGDVEQLIELHGASSCVIAPDRWDVGTNALALPAGSASVPVFGEASFAKHRAAAVQAGLEARVWRSPGLGFDVDTPADLEELRLREPGWWEYAATVSSSLRQASSLGASA